jgi:hypothetical protein
MEPEARFSIPILHKNPNIAYYQCWVVVVLYFYEELPVLVLLEKTNLNVSVPVLLDRFHT